VTSGKAGGFPIQQIVCNTQDGFTWAIAFRNKNHPALHILKRILAI
jgi:hypothetical protein